MWIKEGLYCIYKGKDSFSRQLILFSLCGIVALLDFYFMSDGVESLNLFQQFLYAFLWIIFSMYIIGYEVIFLHDRELPDIDLRPLKLIIKRPLIYFFLFTIPFVIAKFFPQYVRIAFFMEMLLAVPLTMIQAGYSYNYNEEEAYKLYENSCFKDYAILFFKRLGLFALVFFVVSLIIFILFFIAGLCFVILHNVDAETIGKLISANHFIIEKISNIFASVLLIYLLTIATLAWDYELIKTYEKS